MISAFRRTIHVPRAGERTYQEISVTVNDSVWMGRTAQGKLGQDDRPVGDEVEESRKNITLPDYTLAEHMAKALWFGSNPTRRERRFFRTLDLRSSDLFAMRVITFERPVEAGPHSPPSKQFLCSQHLIYGFILDSQGWLVGAVREPGGIRPDSAATARTWFAADRLPGGIVPASGTIADPATLAVLELEVDARWAPMFEDSETQSVEVSASGDKCRIRVLPSSNSVAGLDERERARLLGPTERIDSDSLWIKQAASKWGQGSSDMEVAGALARRVAHWTPSGRLEPGFKASQVFGGGRGDPEAHALLFVALARAVGIPARTCSGLVWMGPEAQVFRGHWWAEVYVSPGAWIAVDPLRVQIPADLTRIRCKPVSDEFLATLALQDRLSITIR